MINTPDKVVFVWLHLRQRDIHIPAAGDFELAIKKSTMKTFLNHFPRYLLSDKDMACPKKKQNCGFLLSYILCHLYCVSFDRPLLHCSSIGFTAVLITKKP